MLKRYPYYAPEKLFFKFKEKNGAVLLLSSDPAEIHTPYQTDQKHKTGQKEKALWSLFAFNPVKSYKSFEFDFLSEAEQDWKHILPTLSKSDLAEMKRHELPFIGGIMGLLSYDLAAFLETLPKLEGEFKTWPDLALGLYDSAVCFNVADQKTIAFCWGGFNSDSVEQSKKQADFFKMIDQAFKEVKQEKDLEKKREKQKTQKEKNTNRIYPSAFPEESTNCATEFRQRTPKKHYLKEIEKTLGYIYEGDIFQANISQGFEIDLKENSHPYNVFLRLIKKSPAPFSAYIRLNEQTCAVTHSPERFFHIDKTGLIETRPIKGSCRRGEDEKTDQTLKQALKNSEKDKAENLMIVDLMRNDLSRIAEPASVNVKELFSLQSFQNIHHLVSIIQARLKPKNTAFDVLRACFPPGSVTGAPKIRAMEIISELEQVKRHAYCGSLGYIGFDGQADFNVMIRSVSFEKQSSEQGLWKGMARSGGGITVGSSPEEEYQETQTKISAIKAILTTP